MDHFELVAAERNEERLVADGVAGHHIGHGFQIHAGIKPAACNIGIQRLAPARLREFTDPEVIAAENVIAAGGAGQFGYELLMHRLVVYRFDVDGYTSLGRKLFRGLLNILSIRYAFHEDADTVFRPARTPGRRRCVCCWGAAACHKRKHHGKCKNQGDHF